MKLSAPKKLTFLVSLIIAIIAVVVNFLVTIPFLTVNAFILLIIAFVILAAGNYLKGF